MSLQAGLDGLSRSIRHWSGMGDKELNALEASVEGLRQELANEDEELATYLSLALELIGTARQDRNAIESLQDPIQRLFTLAIEHLASRSGQAVEIDVELLEMFLSSCGEGLEEIERLLLDLESGASDGEKVASVRRTLHTFKGECGVLSLGVAQSLCHAAETLIDEALESPLEFPTGLLMELVDWSRCYLHRLEIHSGSPPPDHDALLGKLMNWAVGKEAVASSPSPVAETSVPAAPAVEDNSPVTMNMDDQEEDILTEFLNEGFQHLEDSEAALLELEEDPSAGESVDRIFRAFHTIKGVGGFLNLTPVCDLAHITETLLDRFRRQELDFEKAYADVVLAAIDMMGVLLRSLTGGEPAARGTLNRLVARIERAVEGKPDSGETGSVAPALPPGEPPASEDDDAEWEAAVRAAEAQAQTATAELAQELPPPPAPVAQGEPSPTPAPAVSAPTPSASAETPPAVPAAKSEPPKDKIVPAAKPTPKAEPKRKVRLDETIKVSTQRLDVLVDMVGELVIAQQMVVQDPTLQQVSSEWLDRSLSQLGKITRDLQEASMSLRMVTFQSTFQKMHRLVRDVSAKSGKKTRLEVVGAETEVDRNVVEKISDPLVHLIRNAIDHGLESPEDRVDAGKPRDGKVTLSAHHQGGAIIVTVRDDGRGLNRQKIAAKAVEKRLVGANEVNDLSDSAVFRLIFEPGFSTASQVTDISGRGVGMDVVRRNIESMRGKIDIQSVEGEGTAFIVQLPLTLAIIDAMVVRAGDQRFIIPTLSIVQSFVPRPDQIHGLHTGSDMVEVRDVLVPAKSLVSILDLQNTPKPEEPIVLLLEARDQRVCLMVDEILGQQQVVIKSLGKAVPDIPVISGGAILGDGRVALIVDVEGLMSEVDSTTLIK